MEKAVETLLKNPSKVEIAKESNVPAFDNVCQKALQQIIDRNYEKILIDDGMKTIYRYGIACCKKRCRVVSC